MYESLGKFQDLPNLKTKIFEFTSLVCIIKAIVGSGILALPNSFQEIGLLGGSVGLILVGFVSDYTMRLLIKSIHELRKKNFLPQLTDEDDHLNIEFDEVGKALFGKTGFAVSSFALLTTQFGACTSYLIFVTNRCTEVFHDWGLELHRWQIICFLILPILLMLICLRHTKLLSPTAFIGNIALLVGVIAVFFYAYKHETSPQPRLSERTLFDWRGIPVFYGVSCLSYSAHCELVSIEQSSASKKSFSRSIKQAVFFICILYGMWPFFWEFRQICLAFRQRV
jgi:proton-coupled amino acid transporter